ncbi:MAG: hypothetical protein KF824_08695 [Fimbriimonadaceae bacterium]|nr:MAG: hypothetical protein KF824_08695 [Fimbriimonadaceae bacterium]
MKKLLIAVPVLALIGLLVSGYVFAPSDKELIQRALDESTTAAREGKPSPVLDHLSRSFTYGGEATSTYDISKLIHQAKPIIVIHDPSPQIDGESARVVSPVSVTVSFMGQDIDSTFPEVNIELKKENGFKWLFVPEPRWRITSVSAQSLPSN